LLCRPMTWLAPISMLIAGMIVALIKLAETDDICTKMIFTFMLIME